VAIDSIFKVNFTQQSAIGNFIAHFFSSFFFYIIIVFLKHTFWEKRISHHLLIKCYMWLITSVNVRVGRFPQMNNICQCKYFPENDSWLQGTCSRQALQGTFCCNNYFQRYYLGYSFFVLMNIFVNERGGYAPLHLCLIWKGWSINHWGGPFDWKLEVLVPFLESRVIRRQLAPLPMPFFPKRLWSKFWDSHFVQIVTKVKWLCLQGLQNLL